MKRTTERKNLLDLQGKIELAPGYDYKALRERNQNLTASEPGPNHAPALENDPQNPLPGTPEP